MPPTTASSRLSLPTKRRVSSKRLITLALPAGAGPCVLVMAPSLLEHFAAGQQRREDQRSRRLRRHRLLDGAVEDELELVVARDGVVLERQRVEHGPHGASDQRLPPVELA